MSAGEHQFLLGDDPVVHIKRVFGQSIKERHLHDKALPFDRSGGRDLRLPLLEERRLDAGVIGMRAAESNKHTDQSSLAQTVSASESRSFS